MNGFAAATAVELEKRRFDKAGELDYSCFGRIGWWNEAAEKACKTLSSGGRRLAAQKIPSACATTISLNFVRRFDFNHSSMLCLP